MPAAAPRPPPCPGKCWRAARRTPAPTASALSDRQEEECSSWAVSSVSDGRLFSLLAGYYSTGMRIGFISLRAAHCTILDVFPDVQNLASQETVAKGALDRPASDRSMPCQS